MLNVREGKRQLKFANSRYRDGIYGLQLFPTGVSQMDYMRSSAGKSGDQDCNVTWADPSIDMLAAARELAFRLALKAADPTNSSSVSSLGSKSHQVYDSLHRSLGDVFPPKGWLIYQIAKLTPLPVTTPHQRNPSTKCPRLPIEIPLPRSSLTFYASIRSLHSADALRMVATWQKRDHESIGDGQGSRSTNTQWGKLKCGGKITVGRYWCNAGTVWCCWIDIGCGIS